MALLPHPTTSGAFAHLLVRVEARVGSFPGEGWGRVGELRVTRHSSPHHLERLMLMEKQRPETGSESKGLERFLAGWGKGWGFSR